MYECTYIGFRTEAVKRRIRRKFIGVEVDVMTFLREMAWIFLPLKHKNWICAFSVGICLAKSLAHNISATVRGRGWFQGIIAIPTVT